MVTGFAPKVKPPERANLKCFILAWTRCTIKSSMYKTRRHIMLLIQNESASLADLMTERVKAIHKLN